MAESFLDITDLITIADAKRRLSCDHRKAIRIAKKLDGIVVVAGRQLISGKKIEEYLATLPEIAGTVTAREAGEILGLDRQSVTYYYGAELGGALVPGGPRGEHWRFPRGTVLRLKRTLDAKRATRERRALKREQKRRDRGTCG